MNSPSRPDASMNLLTRLTEEALDPGYALATASASVSPGPKRPSKSRLIAVVLVVALGFAGAAAVLEVRSSLPTARAEREALADRVQARTNETDVVAASAAALRGEVDRLSAAASGADTAGLERSVAKLSALAATTPVSGPGVVVTIDDAPAGDTAKLDNPELGRVQDRDLQLVVNGLWAAGATAVAINDQRLTARSAIRSAGDAILVDYRPLAPPYVVTALGDPARLEAQFTDGPAGRSLRLLSDAYGITSSVRTERNLTLPAARTAPLRYAKPSPLDPTASTSQSPGGKS